MGEPTWSITPEQRPVVKFTHTATVEDLLVTVTDLDGWITWRIKGWLEDIEVSAHDYTIGTRRTVEQTKAWTTSIARRLHAAGWRGERNVE